MSRERAFSGSRTEGPLSAAAPMSGVGAVQTQSPTPPLSVQRAPFAGSCVPLPCKPRTVPLRRSTARSATATFAALRWGRRSSRCLKVRGGSRRCLAGPTRRSVLTMGCAPSRTPPSSPATARRGASSQSTGHIGRRLLHPHSRRWRQTLDMTTEPSPTAEATRLTDPARTSPTAKTPGAEVS